MYDNGIFDNPLITVIIITIGTGLCTVPWNILNWGQAQTDWEIQFDLTMRRVREKRNRRERSLIEKLMFQAKENVGLSVLNQKDVYSQNFIAEASLTPILIMHLHDRERSLNDYILKEHF